MTTLTHIATGTVIAKAVLSGNTMDIDPTVFYAVAIFFSNIPDIDIPLYGLRRTVKQNWNHRIHSYLHFPLFWVVLFVLFELITPQKMQRIAKPYETIALVSLGVHFLLDTIGVHRGICWFGPFVRKQLSFTRLVTEPELCGSLIVTYCKSIVFKAEILLSLGSIVYLLIQ